MNLKESYYYIFHRIYLLAKKANPLLAPDFIAGVTLIALEIWLILSLINYYNIVLNRYFNLEKVYFVIIGLAIAAFNIYIFIIKSEWKIYGARFNGFPQRKKTKYNYLVSAFIIFVIVNLIFSFYLMFQIDWSKYR
jgi:hypothetical protein